MPTNSVATIGDDGIVEINPQIVGEERMDVPSDHHWVGHACVGNALKQPRAIGRIAVPIVGPETLYRLLLLPVLRHQDVLADQVPLRLAVGEPGVEPRLLGEAHHAAAGGEPLRTAIIVLDMTAALARRTVAGLAGAILPAVDHRDVDQIAEGEAVIDPHDRAFRMRQDRTHRHVLIERLIRRRALQQKARRFDEPLRPLIGIVVLDFMVVPRDQ